MVEHAVVVVAIAHMVQEAALVHMVEEVALVHTAERSDLAAALVGVVHMFGRWVKVLMTVENLPVS